MNNDDFIKTLLTFFATLNDKVKTALIDENKRNEIKEFIEALEKFNSMDEITAKEYIQKALAENSDLYNSNDTTEEIVEQLYNKPKNLTMVLTKISDNIFGQGANDDCTIPFDIRVSGKNAKKEIDIKDCQLFMPLFPDDLNQASKTLSPYDREVFNGYCSILETGQTVCTSEQIFEVMAGKGTKSKQAIGHVTRSMNKLRTTLISFDWTQHALMKGLNGIEGIIQEDNIIHADSIIIKAYGKEMRGYKSLKTPALLTYSKAIGQMSSIDRNLLDINLNNTPKNIILKNNIIRRIERMKNPRTKTSHNIKIDTLFSACQIKGSKDDLKRDRNTVFRILESLVDKKYIKSYKKNKQGQSLLSIEVHF